jgi:DNA-binding transcriptional LysR family regulator
VKQFTLRHAFRERTVVIFRGAGRDHLQLVLTDRSPLTQGRDLGVIGTQTWRLADLGTKHVLLKQGIGWGYMPEHMVREDAEKGALVQLDMPEVKSGSLRLYAIYRTDTPPGPAGSWLISQFRHRRQARPKQSISARSLRHLAIYETDQQARDEHQCRAGCRVFRCYRPD